MNIYEIIRNHKVDDGITNKFQRQEALKKLSNFVSSLKTQKERKAFVRALRSQINIDPLSEYLIKSGTPGYFI